MRPAWFRVPREKAGGMVPGWTAADEARFREVIRRLNTPEIHDYEPAPMPQLRPEGCTDCTDFDHGHAAEWIGPYLMCRCLACPDLVVGVAVARKEAV